MNVKIEVHSDKAIKDLDRKVEKVLEVVPQEHLRGLSKIVVADTINEPRLSATQRATLPALYHPKMAGQSAWAEISLSVLAPKEKFPKRLLSRLALKSNLAQVVERERGRPQSSLAQTLQTSTGQIRSEVSQKVQSRTREKMSRRDT